MLLQNIHLKPQNTAGRTHTRTLDPSPRVKCVSQFRLILTSETNTGYMLYISLHPQWSLRQHLIIKHSNISERNT